MKFIFSVCLILCLALSANSLRVRTHVKSRSTTSRGWDYYTKDLLIDTGDSFGAGRTRLDGNVWGATASNLEPGEGATIANLFKNLSNAFASGVTVRGLEYPVVKAEESSIYGKKSDAGVVIAQTGQTIIISVYNGSMQPGKAVYVVDRLADYLRDSGY